MKDYKEHLFEKERKSDAFKDLHYGDRTILSV